MSPFSYKLLMLIQKSGKSIKIKSELQKNNKKGLYHLNLSNIQIVINHS